MHYTYVDCASGLHATPCTPDMDCALQQYYCACVTCNHSRNPLCHTYPFYKSYIYEYSKYIIEFQGFEPPPTFRVLSPPLIIHCTAQCLVPLISTDTQIIIVITVT